jgi:hypothetical protein
MFNFRDFQDATREFMIQEIELADATGNIYYSKRFNQAGGSQWVGLLTEAARSHNEHWLAYQIETREMMKGSEVSATPSGGYTVKHVPDTAAETLADGQFNRFYILGLCRHAKNEGAAHLSVYRAKERIDHRAESDALIGTTIPVDQLLAELRDLNTSLRHALLRPNSGLSVRRA